MTAPSTLRLGARLPNAAAPIGLVNHAVPRWSTIMVEGASLAFLIAVLYKLDAVGVAALLTLTGSGFVLPRAWPRLPNKFLLVCATAYLFMSTATAGLYDLQLGLYRFVQFALLTGAAYGFANYLALITVADRERMVRTVAAVCGVVLIHVIAYHMAIGRMSPWKYLADTKAALSFGPLLLFALEVPARRALGTVLWFVILAIAGGLVLMSGERKAYMLLAALFVLSRASIAEKGLLLALAAAAVGLYLSSAGEGDYIARQLQSLFQEDREMHISEFYLIDNIGAYSNVIRDFVNRMAGELFQQYPILGLGAGGYERWSHANLIGSGLPRGLSMNVHGEIHRIPVEGGIVGIGIAVALLAGLAVKTVELQLRAMRGERSVLTGRLPIYVLSFIVIYSSVEALDTLMLSLIVGFAYCVALVPGTGSQ